RHTRFSRDWSSDVCSSDLNNEENRHLRLAKGVIKTNKFKNLDINLSELDIERSKLIVTEAGIHAITIPFNETGGGEAKMLFGVRSEERRVGKECKCERCHE